MSGNEWPTREELNAWTIKVATPHPASFFPISQEDVLALVNIAKAAQALYDEWAAINPPDLLPLPIKRIGDALADLGNTASGLKIKGDA